MSKKETGSLAPRSRASKHNQFYPALLGRSNAKESKDSWWSSRPNDDVGKAVLSVVPQKDSPIWKLRCAVACGGGEKRSGRGPQATATKCMICVRKIEYKD